MCGFTGIFNFNQTQIDTRVLIEMTNAQKHRGPDDQGFIGFSLFNDKSISVLREGEEKHNFIGGIGFNRLSIQDLSSNGHQPMLSQCGNYVIAYNGETYNAHDYRNELIAQGYNFRGHSDTEILLNLYIQYGIEGMLSRLNGMFAFVIVDLKLNKFFIARDQMGIKPMYYYQKNGTFLFSSEIKSFKKHPDFKANLNLQNLDEYLLFRYCAEDRTLLEGVKQLPPASYLEINNSGIKERKYFDLADFKNTDFNQSEILEILENSLKKSIKSQLISDVRVGCQLSGGIDSSLVTSYAREHFDANMDTFSIVFNDEKYSEEAYINYITNLTNSDSHRYQFSTDYIVKNLFTATWHLDQPISIPNTFGIKRLAERSRENVTVLLSGEGADELFGGYSRYHDLQCRLKLQKFKSFPIIGSRLDKKYRFQLSHQDFFILSSSAMSLSDFEMLGQDIENVLQQRRNLFSNSGDIIKNASVYDMKSYMVDLLNRQDKMTMAHSIENRVPFLDLEVVKLVSSIPSDFLVKKISSLNQINKPNEFTKFLLKSLSLNRFNKEFVFRNKSGFPLPMHNLFLQPKMKEIVEDVILPGLCERRVFPEKFVKDLWKKRDNNLSNSEVKNLWMFFAFEIWAQLFIDDKSLC